MNTFDQGINCDSAFTACENVIGKKQVGIAGTDIKSGHKKYILALTWQLARYHYLQLLGSKKEKDIVAWANGIAGSIVEISGFGDKNLSDGRFLIKLCESIDPEVIDWELVTDGSTEEGKNDNAKYAISLARRFGAFIFCVYEDITMANKKMMLIFIAGLYDLYETKHGSQ